MIVHLGLCLLVLVNLLFVHITGVVEIAWVLAFGGLTLLAPVLQRFTTSVSYRLAWNAGVLVLFVSLVQRTLVQGVGRMLEGGLILAVFCQVHLVNNVSDRQRPDLLLFNSFLIAVITAFFCQELSYSVVFVAYAFTLLTVWRVLAHRDGGGSTPLAAVLSQGGRHAFVVLTITTLVFSVWPRNFDRAGFVGDHLLQATRGAAAQDQIRLAHKLSPVQSDRVVLRIRGKGEIPTHWRGSTFPLLQEGAWHATTTVQDTLRFGATAHLHALDPPWNEEGHGRWLRQATSTLPPLRVELLDLARGRLFLPEDAARVTLASTDAHEIPHIPLSDATFALFADFGDTRPSITYEVERANDITQPTGWSRSRVQNWLGLDPGAVPTEALTLAQEIRSALPINAPQREIAAAMCAHLRANFAYGLPGQAQCATSLHEFFRLRRGHCEFFASALAMMLRSQRVPCRLVGGFLAIERGEDDTVVVRAKHAHAWVEAYEFNHGWYTLEPTPAPPDTTTATTWLGQVLSRAEAMWTSVTGFDERRRARAIAWLVAAPSNSMALVAAHPFLATGVSALLVWWGWRRRRRAPPGVAEYRRALRRLRLALLPGETPRQLLARAHAAALPASALASLRAATEQHERLRYVPAPNAAQPATAS